MISVVDTSVLIDHLRGVEAARLALASARRNGDVWSVTVVRTEVIAGMRRGEERVTLALLDTLHWHDVTVELADRAGRLATRFLRSHRGVDTSDYLIAAAVELLSGTLLTLNVKHFPMFAGLSPAY